MKAQRNVICACSQYQTKAVCLYLSSKWIQTRLCTRNMLTKNVRLPFVPKYNESLGHNAIIEWKNGAIPAREMVKFRLKTQASRRNHFDFSGIRLVIFHVFASIVAFISPKIYNI